MLVRDVHKWNIILLIFRRHDNISCLLQKSSLKHWVCVTNWYFSRPKFALWDPTFVVVWCKSVREIIFFTFYFIVLYCLICDIKRQFRIKKILKFSLKCIFLFHPVPTSLFFFFFKKKKKKKIKISQPFEVYFSSLKCETCMQLYPPFAAYGDCFYNFSVLYNYNENMML